MKSDIIWQLLSLGPYIKKENRGRDKDDVRLLRPLPGQQILWKMLI
jgi:hypothetical protein